MNFVDDIDIYIASGNGGNGATSFSKIKSKKPHPDGGNGGNGGDVYLYGNENCFNFSKMKFKSKYKAENGANGKKNCMTGKNGKNLYISVPLGTSVYDNERKLLIGEILHHKQLLLIAKGGKGGLGNYITEKTHLQKVKYGENQQIKYIHLELHLLSDIGLFGYPNAGKSFFLNTFTRAYSKASFYAFTTLHPKIGTLISSKRQNILLADIPGIIKDASKGKGLGFNFLKHLEKTKLLLHIFDITDVINIKTFIKKIFVINNELKKFNKFFLYKEKWLIFNKTDIFIAHDLQISNKFLRKFNYKYIFYISLKNKKCIKKLNFNLIKYFFFNK